LLEVVKGGLDGLKMSVRHETDYVLAWREERELAEGRRRAR